MQSRAISHRTVHNNPTDVNGPWTFEPLNPLLFEGGEESRRNRGGRRRLSGR